MWLVNLAACWGRQHFGVVVEHCLCGGCRSDAMLHVQSATIAVLLTMSALIWYHDMTVSVSPLDGWMITSALLVIQHTAHGLLTCTYRSPCRLQLQASRVDVYTRVLHRWSMVVGGGGLLAWPWLGGRRRLLWRVVGCRAPGDLDDGEDSCMAVWGFSSIGECDAAGTGVRLAARWRVEAILWEDYIQPVHEIQS